MDTCAARRIRTRSSGPRRVLKELAGAAGFGTKKMTKKMKKKMNPVAMEASLMTCGFSQESPHHCRVNVQTKCLYPGAKQNSTIPSQAERHPATLVEQQVVDCRNPCSLFSFKVGSAAMTCCAGRE
eukprot:s588_g15.t1